MATFTLAQASTSAIPAINGTVDIKQFTALEQKVDTLVTQLQQLLPPRQFNLKGLTSTVPLTPELSLPGTPQVIEPQTFNVVVSEPETPATKVAHQILDIIQRYGHNVGAKNAPGPWAGRAKFVPTVEAHVSKNEPVQMVLPAFPFKSPNRIDKVIGNMPDLGEELALMHLNGLCESITEIYEPGATVVIASDGLVYNGKCEVQNTLAIIHAS